MCKNNKILNFDGTWQIKFFGLKMVYTASIYVYKHIPHVFSNPSFNISAIPTSEECEVADG